MSYLFVILISTANAGLWSDFCERHLIADDPYQYETYPEKWIVQQIAMLEIRVRWSSARKRDEATLKILRDELERRSQ